MDRQRITAQLGCGALILVIVAAYIGAVAGTERSGSAAREDARPSIFSVGNHVRQLGNSDAPLPVVFRVVAVEGSWVKLEADEDATTAALVETLSPAETSAAEPGEREAAIERFKDPVQNPWMAAIRSQYRGQWWINTANTTGMWQQVELDAP